MKTSFILLLSLAITCTSQAATGKYRLLLLESPKGKEQRESWGTPMRVSCVNRNAPESSLQNLGLVPKELSIEWVVVQTKTVNDYQQASAPIVVDDDAHTAYLPPDRVTVNAVVVCPPNPVLAVTIRATPGTTNELQWRGTGETTWTSSNVRRIAGTNEVRFYVLDRTNSAIFRLRRW